MEGDKKLRYSRQRERIYEYLAASEEHPSAEMVYEALKSEIKGLSLGTVYRNLRLLEDLGKVRRVTSFRNIERYDACCGDHVHFICTECGRIIDVPEADIQKIREATALGEGYSLSQINLTLNGLCPECQMKDHSKN